jgi:alpha-glucoside transport system permease protein
MEERRMERADAVATPPPRGIAQVLAAGVGRILVSIFVPVVAFVVLWAGFLWLKDSGAPRIVIVLVAIVWGIGGVAMLYVVANWLTEKLPATWQGRILPFVFVGPALAILTFYLLIPAVLTAWASLFDANGQEFVGLDNYVYSFTNPEMVTAIRNNVLWLVFGTVFSTGMGLRWRCRWRSRLDRLLPDPDLPADGHLVCQASVIWRLCTRTSPRLAQIAANAILGAFGLVSWLTGELLNTILLIVILIFGPDGLRDGHRCRPRACRTRCSRPGGLTGRRVAGLPAPHRAEHLADDRHRGDDDRHPHPEDLLSSRPTGALQHPGHRDFMGQAFTFFDAGRGAALAIILLVAVTPVIWYNLRQFRGRAI